MLWKKNFKSKSGNALFNSFIFLYLAAIASIIFGGNLLSKQNNLGAVFLTIGIIWVSIGFVPFLGLKIIKPQEALVLTLFGNYIGTLKEAGFFLLILLQLLLTQLPKPVLDKVMMSAIFPV